MKIASVTSVYNGGVFLRPHMKMISNLDYNIVLMGKPFKDYTAAGFTIPTPDGSREILEKEFKDVIMVENDIEYFCGDLLNLGIDKARELGCDAIIKLDLDMFLTQEDYDFLLSVIESKPFQCYTLNYRKCTKVLYKDFDHMVDCEILHGYGADPMVVNTNNRFIQDGVKILTDATEVDYISWDDFCIYHFSGWKPSIGDEKLREVEALPGFDGWQKCPEEIRNMFE